MKKWENNFVKMSLGIITDLDERQAHEIYFRATVGYCLSMMVMSVVAILNTVIANIGQSDGFIFPFSSIFLCISVLLIGFYVEVKIKKEIKVIEVTDKSEYLRVKKSLLGLSLVTGFSGMIAAFILGMIAVVTISIPMIFMVIQTIILGIICYFVQYLDWNKRIVIIDLKGDTENEDD